MTKEVWRKYKYIWTEHTMVRLHKDWPKVRIENGETFESSLEKRVFSIGFQFLDDCIVENTTPMEKKKIENTIKESKKELEKRYFDKFGKQPFRGWSEEQVLEKINTI